MGNKSGTLRIIMQRADGGISVDAPIERIANDPAQLAAHIVRLEGMGHTILKGDATGADLPNERPGQSRRFRNAWRWDGAKIEADLDLSRAQVMAEVRAERNERLATSRANEQQGNPEQQSWKAHRQALRDLPTTVQSEIDIIATPSALEAYEPTWPVEPS
jgi:hypothetical protein